MGSRPTQAQMEALVDFLEQNPEIARGLLKTQHAKQDTKRKWANIAINLNALGGVVKDGAGWSKYWSEKKCALKKICAQQAQSIQRTGGGTQVLPTLGPVESRLVAVMGGQSFASGDTHFAVDPFPQRRLSQSILVDVDLPFTSTQADTGHVAPNLGLLPSQENIGAPPDIEQTVPSSRRRRTRELRGIRSQLDIEVDRFCDIEVRRVEAEQRTAQALSDGFTVYANAMKESAQLLADALMQIARRLPSPPAD